MQRSEIEDKLDNAAANGDLKIVKDLLAVGVNISDYTLLYAIWYGKTEVVKILLENGADMHAKGDTALMWAANSGRRKIAKILLEKGNWTEEDKKKAHSIALYNRMEETAAVIDKYLEKKPPGPSFSSSPS